MQKIITVIGATGSGKSDFAVKLAKRFNGEVISADSRQIYKGLDLSTGKVTPEEMDGVPHHLLNIVPLGKPYSVYNFKQDATKAIGGISSRGKLPIICGGTGLYTRALVEGFSLTERDIDNAVASELEEKTIEELQQIIATNNIPLVETDIKNKRRLISAIVKHKHNILEAENAPEYNALQICLVFPREQQRERIKARLKARLDAGMLAEIEEAIKAGADPEFLKTLGLDMRYSVMQLNGEFKNYDEFFETLFTKECQYAKRQQTWFKKEKNCIYINPLEDDAFETACTQIKNFLGK